MSRSYKKINFSDSEWIASKKTLIEKLNCQSSSPQSADLIWSDCQWTDNTADPKWMDQLKPNQSINYFHNASETFRKDTLTENINGYEKKYPKVFEDVLPKSWNLPKQFEEFREYLAANKSNKSGNKQYFIVKENDEQRGVGIYITDQPEKDLNKTSDVVVSKYIGNPLLVDDCKFDFRIHVLVASLEPFTVFVHNEGLMRMASFKYEKPTIENRNNLYMHLTNLSLNKFNEESVHEALAGDNLSPDESDNKLARSFDHFRKCLKKMGKNDQEIIDQMDKLIGKVLVCCYDDMRMNYESKFGKIGKNSSETTKNLANKCFQVLGFDIMFDEHFKPWFIEVNHNPDFVDEPKIASLLVRKTIYDTMEKMSEINDIKFETTALTGDDSYDCLYEMPNMYRKVDIKGIRKEMEEERAEQVKRQNTLDIALDNRGRARTSTSKSLDLKELTDNMYRTPYADRILRTSRTRSRGVRDN